MDRGFNASKVKLPYSTYDIFVETSKSNFIRVQVKTVSGSGFLNFGGEKRGSIEDTESSDIVVGVRSEKSNGDKTIDYFFIPTIIIKKIDQKSMPINKIPMAKNNWELFCRCKDSDYVVDRFSLLLPNGTRSKNESFVCV